MDFQHTHTIHKDGQDPIEIMLSDGAAYTREEWAANAPADYEQQKDGSWTCHGQAFAGRVYPADGLTVRPTGYLYHRYQGQTGPQPCYLELCEDGTVLTDYDGEIGNAVPASVWHGRDLRWSLPAALKSDRADALIAHLRPLLVRVYEGHDVEWDGNNHVGRLDDDASQASAEIDREIERWCDETDYVQVWDSSLWLQDETPGTLGITGSTTDAELDAIAQRLREDAENEGVDELEGLDAHLRELRQQAADQEAEALLSD